MKRAIIFDIDGVLVDVSNSYRTAIAKTAEYFTRQEVLSEEINELKQQTGFNNDWDLTEALIKKRGVSVTYQKIVDKFQELYLGVNGKEGLMRSINSSRALSQSEKGLIENEKWLLDRNLLEDLSKKYLIGILTGRSREEAFIPLRKAGAEKYFSVIVAMEDCGGKGKPNPFGLNLVMEKLRVVDKANSIYVGDVPDDMRAAKNAGMIGIGCLPPQNKTNELKESLISAGTKEVLQEVNEIRKVVL